jgi:ABC-type multidrug transport system ATPase subunit
LPFARGADNLRRPAATRRATRGARRDHRMEHALTLHGVTKRFGSFTAVSDLSLEVPKGCIYGFLGQNGAGKTTTIRMVMSIFHPDEGTISVLGRPDAAEVKDCPRRRVSTRR